MKRLKIYWAVPGKITRVRTINGKTEIFCAYGGNIGKWYQVAA